MHKISLILFLAVCLVLPISVLAQDATEPVLCGNIFPRYQGQQNRLQLVDWTTGNEVATLEEQLVGQFTFSWSPNCRYLAGVLTSDHYVTSWESWGGGDPSLVIWDTNTYERVFISRYSRYINLQRGYGGRVYWKPDSSAALIVPFSRDYRALGGRGEGELWFANSGQSIPLDDENETNYFVPRATFLQVYWDDARNWLWSSSGAGVVAFDISTGLQALDLRNPPWIERQRDVPQSRFVFSVDGTKIVVYTIAENGSSDAAAVTVWDLHTMTGTPVYAGDIAGAYITSGDRHPVALSPDNRYLVVGYDALRVWDLTELPEVYEERLPIYRHGGPDSMVTNVRFVDFGVIETTSNDGLQQWELHTGVYIPQ